MCFLTSLYIDKAWVIVATACDIFKVPQIQALHKPPLQAQQSSAQSVARPWRFTSTSFYITAKSSVLSSFLSPLKYSTLKQRKRSRGGSRTNRIRRLFYPRSNNDRSRVWGRQWWVIWAKIGAENKDYCVAPSVKREWIVIFSDVL